MANNKFYQAKKTINGVEYTAQFNGLSSALKAMDETYIDGTGNHSQVKLAKYILENIIVEPNGLGVDDFADMEELNDVIAFGREVMMGKFRPKDKGSEK